MNVPAIDIYVGDKECYIAVMDAKDVFKYSIVSRAEEDKKGYQRLLSPKRAKDIAEYINDGGIIPGCVILSAQSNANLTFSSDKISFEEHEDSFFVIDGQHRLFGANESTEENIKIPVYIFNNLEIPEEVQYFLDVNSKQKGVPKTLRIELTKFLSEPGSRDEIRLQLFNKLNDDPESPLFNRLSSTTSVPGKLSHVPFQQVIDPLLEKEPMNVFDFDKKYMLLKNFLTAIDTILTDNFGDSKRLTTTVFFNAIFNNFDMIFNRVVMKGNLQVENFIDVINPIKDIDFDEYKGTGKAADKELTDEIKLRIETNFNSSENFDSLFS